MKQFPSSLYLRYKRYRRRICRNASLLTGEASPYYLFHPLAAKRAAQVVPRAKLIVLLRNPVERAFSHYLHECRKGRESLSFQEAIKAEEERLRGEGTRIRQDPGYNSISHQHHSYLARGDYLPQIKEWSQAYSSDNMFVLQSEQMFAQPEAVYESVLDFLDLPRWFPDNFLQTNAGPQEDMNPEMRTSLQDYFRPKNEALFDYLEQYFDW